MAVHHGRDLAHDLAAHDGHHEVMSRRGEIVAELAALDGMVEHVGGNAVEQRLVAGPDVADFDGHGLSIAD